jgi:hypothetical protein
MADPIGTAGLPAGGGGDDLSATRQAAARILHDARVQADAIIAEAMAGLQRIRDSLKSDG